MCDVVRRDELEHAIRAACQILGAPEVIILGSQSILGSYREPELPVTATISQEVDILPIADGADEVDDMADLLEGVAGEDSSFEQLHGFSIDGVGLDTYALPDGWRERLVKLQNVNTAAPGGEPQFTGWCLEPHDLCASKLCAFRDKDIAFVGALLDAGLVDGALVAERIHARRRTRMQRCALRRGCERGAASDVLRADRAQRGEHRRRQRALETTAWPVEARQRYACCCVRRWSWSHIAGSDVP